MSFKKVFAACLSVLFVPAPISLQAMNENEVNKGEGTVGYNNQCPVCFHSVDGFNEIVLDCGHKHHLGCLARWVEERRKTCPVCDVTIGDHKVIDLLTTSPLKAIWDTLGVGVLDINDLAKIKNKSVDDVIDDLVKPVYTGEYREMNCMPEQDIAMGGIIYCVSRGLYGGDEVQLFMVDTEEGPVNVRILDADLRKKFRDTVTKAMNQRAWDIKCASDMARDQYEKRRARWLFLLISVSVILGGLLASQELYSEFSKLLNYLR